MAKNNTIFWIAGIILVLLLIQNYQKPEDFSIEPHYYKNGMEIILAPGFSIVRGTYDEISFNIYGSETEGSPISNLHITDASPTAFSNALPTTYQSLNPYETKLLWVSDRISTAQFEGMAQPVEFQVEVTSGETSEISSTFLSIFEEPTMQVYDDYEDMIFDTDKWSLAAYSYSNPNMYVEAFESVNYIEMAVYETTDYNNDVYHALKIQPLLLPQSQDLQEIEFEIFTQGSARIGSDWTNNNGFVLTIFGQKVAQLVFGGKIYKSSSTYQTGYSLSGVWNGIKQPNGDWDIYWSGATNPDAIWKTISPSSDITYLYNFEPSDYVCCAQFSWVIRMHEIKYLLDAG